MSPARSSKSSVALLPGARMVFTHGLGESPAAEAFCATRPHASIMRGSVAVVQLVTAAIAIAPWPISRASPPTSTGMRLPLSSPRSAHTARKRSRTPESGMRSCGRDGPASERSTEPKSSSITSA